jgi:signal transduction histidine kinase
MRKILFFIVISSLVSSGNSSAQNIYIDSVRKELVVTKDDTSRVLLLSQLGYYWRYTNIDSSTHYSKAALSLALQLKYPRGEANALTNLGFAFREKGELPRALEFQLSALRIAEKYRYLLEEGNSLRRIGIVYWDISDFYKAMDYCRKAIYIHQQIENNQQDLGSDYILISYVYGERNLDSAWYFIQKAREKISYIKDGEPEFYLARGRIYWLKGNRDSALADWREGLRSSLSMQTFRTASRIFDEMGNMYREMNRPDSGIFYAEKGLEYGEKASNEKGILMSSKLLFELYDSLNQPAKALYYSKIASAAKDSLFGAENIQTIRDLIARENERQNEIEATRTSYQNRLRQFMLSLGMGAFIIIAIILFRNNLRKQKTNFILGKQRDEIQNALTQLKSTQAQLIQSEKMASLGEITAGIAHEIQNPLNFVNNFSQINTELIDETQVAIKGSKTVEAIELLSNLRNNEVKITEHGQRADAIVKAMMLHSRTGSGQKEPVKINNLVKEYLRLSYQSQKAKDKTLHVELNHDLDENVGKVEIVTQDIGRVLLNLFNNAFYAVSEKRKFNIPQYEPAVWVSTRKRDGRILISVRDNGQGIPEKIKDKIFQPFFTTKPAGQGTGLGLSLAYDIVKAHGGEIMVESNEGEGSSFTIQIPNG